MCTAHLETVRASVVTTRCRSQGVSGLMLRGKGVGTCMYSEVQCIMDNAQMVEKH